MGRAIKFASVCSGIEAVSVAWHPLGWQAALLSEIEPFPRRVLEHRQRAEDARRHRSGFGPALWGDFTTIRPRHLRRLGIDTAIDLLVAGTPCQSFSVAGLRGGLDDSRGNLALEYLRLARRLRPRWLVWENVPGVLSSNGGRDFGAILGGMAELGYGFAYRVLDAQNFGVPQRRRRVFVVGYLGDWRRAAAVLFERQSVQGNPAPIREAREGNSGTIAGGARRKGGYSHDDVQLTAFGGGNCSGSIKVSAALTAPVRRQDFEVETFIAHTLRGEGFDASENATDRGITLAPMAIQERAVSENPSAGPGGAGFRTDGIAYTLEARTVPQAVAFNCREDPVSGEKFGALGASSPQAQAISYPGCVRRLTPRECERLQGFPDDYTRVPLVNKRGRLTGKFAADGPRYKSLGNSMAVPVMRWIGERIAAVDAMPHQILEAAQ